MAYLIIAWKLFVLLRGNIDYDIPAEREMRRRVEDRAVRQK